MRWGIAGFVVLLGCGVTIDEQGSWVSMQEMRGTLGPVDVSGAAVLANADRYWDADSGKRPGFVANGYGRDGYVMVDVRMPNAGCSLAEGLTVSEGGEGEVSVWACANPLDPEKPEFDRRAEDIDVFVEDTETGRNFTLLARFPNELDALEITRLTWRAPRGHRPCTDRPD